MNKEFLRRFTIAIASFLAGMLFWQFVIGIWFLDSGKLDYFGAFVFIASLLTTAILVWKK